MSLTAAQFFQAARAYIDQLESTQMESISKAADLLAGAVMKGGVIQLFGTGHSKAFAMEMANRAGGLVPANAIDMEIIFTNGLQPAERRHDPTVEREPEVAHQVLSQYNIQPEDAMIIISNSGRNGSTVEMAMEAKRRGMPLIVVTSMAHTTQVTSRHPSGKRLFELADVVIDNCGPYGDALLPLEGKPYKACSISSITGAFIAEGLTAEIVARMLAAGVEPPILVSANVDGGDAHNKALRAKYAGRIRW